MLPEKDFPVLARPGPRMRAQVEIMNVGHTRAVFSINDIENTVTTQLGGPVGSDTQSALLSGLRGMRSPMFMSDIARR
jgi:hypothetical protein